MSRDCDEFDELCNIFDIERDEVSPSHSPLRNEDYSDDEMNDSDKDNNDPDKFISESILEIPSAPLTDESFLEHSSLSLPRSVP